MRQLVEVDLVTERSGKAGDDLDGVVAGAVEAAIDERLDLSPDGLEEAGHGQRGDRDRDRERIVLSHAQPAQRAHPARLPGAPP